MSLWNGKKKELPKLSHAHNKEDDDFSEDDEIYVLQKKVDALINDKEREMALLKAQIHDNTQFLQQIILELIAKGSSGTVVRSTSVPVKDVNVKSVKELVADARQNGPMAAGPAGKLP
jgi:hypothetical protein